MGEQSAKPDLVISTIAGRQHGVVSIWQLRDTGIGRNAVTVRVRAGRLHRVHRGVYAVGYLAPSDEARWMAAVLACGGKPEDASDRGAKQEKRIAHRARDGGGQLEEDSDGTILGHRRAALSHRSAASLWGLLPAADGAVDVSVPGDVGKSRRKGIRLHRCLSLLPADVTLHRGIPVTTPARTISDLRRVAVGSRPRGLSPRDLRRAIRQADVLGLPIGLDDDRDRTRSDLERTFLRLCRRHRLPVPEVNVRIGRHLVDFLWRDQRLVVETDGYRYHRGRAAFEDDRARDLELRAQGFEVVRLAEKQVRGDAPRVAEVVAAAIRDRAGRGRQREATSLAP